MKDFKRKADDSIESKESEVVAATAPAVEYSDWFTIRLKANDNLKVHHHGAILAYFKSNGLEDSESMESYDQMLKVFGY